MTDELHQLVRKSVSMQQGLAELSIASRGGLDALLPGLARDCRHRDTAMGLVPRI